MTPTPALDKYVLHKVNDSVVLTLNDPGANTVTAQVVQGDGEIRVEVSMDFGWSWWPIQLLDMQHLMYKGVLSLGAPAWAEAPGITNARAVLCKNPSAGPCKVNLRYGRA